MFHSIKRNRSGFVFVHRVRDCERRTGAIDLDSFGWRKRWVRIFGSTLGRSFQQKKKGFYFQQKQTSRSRFWAVGWADWGKRWSCRRQKSTGEGYVKFGHNRGDNGVVHHEWASAAQ